MSIAPDPAGGETIPLLVPDLRGREAEYLAACVHDGWVSSAGPNVGELERRMAVLAKSDYGVATVNGSAALHLSLLVAGVTPEDLVIVPDWTFAATANAVCHAGATPYFVDVTQDSWTLDPRLTEQAIETAARNGQSVAAVIAVHALGHPADLDPLVELCGRRRIALIEDAACAIGSLYKGRPVGSIGDAAMFSFNGNKTITAGGGGMIATDNQQWAERARSLSTQSRIGSDYSYGEVGFNYRMTNVNAAIALAQLERLDEMLQAKQAIAERYEAAIGDRDDIKPMPRAPWAKSYCWLYSAAVAEPDDAASLVAHLGKRNIEARLFWRALSPQTPYRDAPNQLTGVSQALSGRVVSLPSSSQLTPAHQERVITALREWRGARLEGQR